MDNTAMPQYQLLDASIEDIPRDILTRYGNHNPPLPEKNDNTRAIKFVQAEWAKQMVTMDVDYYLHEYELIKEQYRRKFNRLETLRQVSWQRKARRAREDYGKFLRHHECARKGLWHQHLGTTPTFMVGMSHEGDQDPRFMGLFMYSQEGNYKTETLSLTEEQALGMVGNNALQDVKAKSGGRFVHIEKWIAQNLDTRQVDRVRYIPPRGESNEGRFEVRDGNGVIAMAEGEDILSYVSPDVREKAIQQAEKFKRNKSRFIPVPPGDAAKHGKLTMDNSRFPRVGYQQGDNPLCLPFAFLSALEYMGVEEEAQWLANEGVFVGENDPWRWVKENMPSDCTIKWLKTGGDCLTVMLQQEHDAFLLVEGHDTNKTVKHAFAVCNGLIFDATEERAIPLTSNHLDRCVSDTLEKRRFGPEPICLHVSTRGTRQMLCPHQEAVEAFQRATGFLWKCPDVPHCAGLHCISTKKVKEYILTKTAGRYTTTTPKMTF